MTKPLIKSLFLLVIMFTSVICHNYVEAQTPEYNNVPSVSECTAAHNKNLADQGKECLRRIYYWCKDKIDYVNDKLEPFYTTCNQLIDYCLERTFPTSYCCGLSNGEAKSCAAIGRALTGATEQCTNDGKKGCILVTKGNKDYTFSENGECYKNSGTSSSTSTTLFNNLSTRYRVFGEPIVIPEDCNFFENNESLPQLQYLLPID